MPAGQRGPLSTRGTSEAGGGIGSKIFCSSLGGTQINNNSPQTKSPPHSICRNAAGCRFIQFFRWSHYATGKEVKLLSKYCIRTVTSVMSSWLSFWQSELASCV